MNYGPLIFLGIFFTTALSWLGLVLGPQRQLSKIEPAPNESTGGAYPIYRAGTAQQGAQVYRANGCYYCHSQQVGPSNVTSDQERGWGARRTVASDFYYEDPVMAGSLRIGPDLANYGARQKGDQYILAHLYDPQSTMPPNYKSNMPRYPYLFERRKGSGSTDAVQFPPNYVKEAGHEVIPTREALALVAYLKSLQANTPLYEIPSLNPSTNAVASTNAPAGTNDSATALPEGNNAPAATNDVPAK